ncbi:hypothetical protein IID19_05140 [Patescibacteria group bacterium]|nr:hypothetical protein [Patescibacteria group bacterium]
MPDNEQAKFKLKIDVLPKIEEILDEFDYLPSCTQKRNLAYRIQYFYFLKEVHLKYDIYGSVSSLVILDIISLMSNILEHILFIVLTQIRGAPPNYYNKSNSSRLGNMISDAEDLGLLPRGGKDKIFYISNLRNELHPERQRDLHSKFKFKDLLNFEDAYNWTLHYLRISMKGKQVPTDILESSCPYREINEGEICSWCYNYHRDRTADFQNVTTLSQE